jgi:hypothetical protein
MPKGNNDMMQCVTCNKFSLFALRQETNNFSKNFEVQNTHSFLYEVQTWNNTNYKRHCSISLNRNVKWSECKIVVMMTTNGPYT